MATRPAPTTPTTRFTLGAILWKAWWYGLLAWHVAYVVFLHQFQWAFLPLGASWLAGVFSVEPSIRYFDRLNRRTNEMKSEAGSTALRIEDGAKGREVAALTGVADEGLQSDTNTASVQRVGEPTDADGPSASLRAAISHRIGAITPSFDDFDICAIEKWYLTAYPTIDHAIERQFVETACSALTRIAAITGCSAYSRRAAKARTGGCHYLDVVTDLHTAAGEVDPRSSMQGEIRRELDRLNALWRFQDCEVSDCASIYTFAWSPAEEDFLGAILLPKAPFPRLTAAVYWNALAARIDRLVAAETEEDAWALLSVVASEDSAVILRSLADAGNAIAHRSEWLRAKLVFPIDGLPADQVRHDADLYDSLTLGDDTLETFLEQLYF